MSIASIIGTSIIIGVVLYIVGIFIYALFKDRLLALYLNRMPGFKILREDLKVAYNENLTEKQVVDKFTDKGYSLLQIRIAIKLNQKEMMKHGEKTRQFPRQEPSKPTRTTEINTRENTSNAQHSNLQDGKTSSNGTTEQYFS